LKATESFVPAQRELEAAKHNTGNTGGAPASPVP